MSTPPTATAVVTSEIGTYRRIFDALFADVYKLLDGLPDAALVWRPFETSPWEGTSSQLGMIVAHAVSSTYYLLRRAEYSMGCREWAAVEGDEGSQEFGPANHEVAYLRARVARTQAFVHEFLDGLSPADLETSRTNPKGNRTFTARHDIMHAFDHLSQHLGHAQLTRQLWAIQAAS
jgi:hypothetical protein